MTSGERIDTCAVWDDDLFPEASASQNGNPRFVRSN